MRNASESLLERSTFLDTQRSIKSLVKQENKVLGRVKYLEKANAKAASKMAVVEAQIEHRERAIQAKEQDELRQALRMKRDEALEEERRALVREKIIARIQEKNLIEEEKQQRQEEINMQKLYDKMLMQVEKTMNSEIK